MADLPSNSALTRHGVIKGLDEIKKKLKRMEDKVVMNINRSAARAGAKVLAQEADNNLPGKHRGKKKISFQRSRRQSRKVGYDIFNIGPLAEHWPLVFLEYGAAPHDILPKTAKTLSFADFNSQSGTWGEFVYTKKVRHPGINATHFLSRALSADDKVYKVVGDQYWKRIKKAAK